MMAYTAAKGFIQFSRDNLFNPHWDPLEAQDCFLNILYPGCDEAHGPDHRQGSA